MEVSSQSLQWTQGLQVRPKNSATNMVSGVLVFLVCVVGLGNSRPAQDYSESRFPVRGESEEVRLAAIKRLLEVFGMEDPPAALGRSHKQPPQYMLDLYNTVADTDGVTKNPTLLEGNTVRGFFDKCKLSFICFHKCPFPAGLANHSFNHHLYLYNYSPTLCWKNKYIYIDIL